MRYNKVSARPVISAGARGIFFTGAKSSDEWALNDDQRLLKGRAASIVVGAMQMHNVELELWNLGLQRQLLTHAAFADDSDAQLWLHSAAQPPQLSARAGRW